MLCSKSPHYKWEARQMAIVYLNWDYLLDIIIVHYTTSVPILL